MLLIAIYSINPILNFMYNYLSPQSESDFMDFSDLSDVSFPLFIATKLSWIDNDFLIFLI